MSRSEHVACNVRHPRGILIGPVTDPWNKRQKFNFLFFFFKETKGATKIEKMREIQKTWIMYLIKVKVRTGRAVCFTSGTTTRLVSLTSADADANVRTSRLSCFDGGVSAALPLPRLLRPLHSWGRHRNSCFSVREASLGSVLRRVWVFFFLFLVCGGWRRFRSEGLSAQLDEEQEL